MILEKDQDMKKEHDILKSCRNINVQCGQECSYNVLRDGLQILLRISSELINFYSREIIRKATVF